MPNHHTNTPTPYYPQKDWWHFNARNTKQKPHLTPQKITSSNMIKKHNPTALVDQTHQFHKYLKNNDIDKILSNDFWENPIITYKHNTCLIKFQTQQYMDHT